MRYIALFFFVATTGLLAQSGGFEWRIPRPFPRPAVPADNPMNASRAALGRFLFYDKRMFPGEFSYPAPNIGLYQYTHRREDIGRFRAPTLRNIAVTAPYMHDGSISSLGEVIDHYSAGGRTIASGPFAGIGHDNPNKAPNVPGFTLTDAEKKDLIALLESLTDTEFLNNPQLGDPWKK